MDRWKLSWTMYTVHVLLWVVVLVWCWFVTGTISASAATINSMDTNWKHPLRTFNVDRNGTIRPKQLHWQQPSPISFFRRLNRTFCHFHAPIHMICTKHLVSTTETRIYPSIYVYKINIQTWQLEERGIDYIQNYLSDIQTMLLGNRKTFQPLSNSHLLQ